MKTVGLLSGGKDSVYNLLHCIVNDHEPVALATLGPPIGQDEIDSYIYQTVGNSGINYIAKAIGLPLFEYTIQGSAINITSEYGSREGKGKGKSTEAEEDETEDLYQLLLKVKTAMPEVEAVACGAILSNYQRVRVEHVCNRLGLVPIAYLWERNQEELLYEMIAAGMDSILLKVAGAGLLVEHLGKNLKSMEPTLHRLNTKFKLHVCGEGGEYETFTLDCPIFRQRVVLEKVVTVISNDDPHSTVAHLRLDHCSLADKPDYPLHETWEEKRDRIRKLVKTPSVLNEKATELYDQLSITGQDSELSLSTLEISPPVVNSIDSAAAVPKITRWGDWIGFGEIFGTEDGNEDLTIEEEVRRCFRQLEELLATESASLLSISHLNVYLSKSSMPLFPLINSVYSSNFGTSPPTRACVAVMLPEQGARIMLEGVAKIGGERKALHVQSLSYWASANIGPYSQTITIDQRLFMAGQIPLIPSSLTLPSPPSIAYDTALSLQHIERVVEAAREGRWQGNCESAICWIADSDERSWRNTLEVARRGWASCDERSNCPAIFISAATLPKSATIEWQVTYQTEVQIAIASEDDEDDSILDNSISFDQGQSGELPQLVEWSVSSVPDGGDRAGYLAFRGDRQPQLNEEIVAKFGQVYSIRAFYRPSKVSKASVMRTARSVLGTAACSFIGVDKIASMLNVDFDFAFVVLAIALCP